MNINELTIGEAKELAALFEKTEPVAHGAIGKKCIVRTYASGVFFGTVVSVASNDGRSRCELKDARRLWKWYGGLSLSEISQNGIVPEKSRLSMVTPSHFIEDAIEFIPASAPAIKKIEGAEADGC